MADRFGERIRLQHRLVRLDAGRKVARFGSGPEVPYERLLSTMPLDAFIARTEELAPAAWELRYSWPKYRNRTKKPFDAAQLVRDTLDELLAVDLMKGAREFVMHGTAGPERGYPTPSFARDRILAELFPAMGARGS